MKRSDRIVVSLATNQNVNAAREGYLYARVAADDEEANRLAAQEANLSKGEVLIFKAVKAITPKYEVTTEDLT